MPHNLQSVYSPLWFHISIGINRENVNERVAELLNSSEFLPFAKKQAKLPQKGFRFFRAEWYL
jgi:hypothetical protein